MNKEILLSFHTNIAANANPNTQNGCVVAVGGFDGVHIGHLSLIKSLTDQAKRLSLPAVVFMFDYFDNPKNGNQMLLSPNLGASILMDNGVDIVLTAPFSKIKSVSATDFVTEFLYKGLGAKSVICGYDFRFGNNREGDSVLISNLLSGKGVSVITPPPVLENGTPVSATLIRNLIAKGDIKQANRLLCRSFGFVNPVVHGAKLGRTLGFPTINQQYPQTMVKPPYGVYLTTVKIEGKNYYGITNFGVKPTVSAGEVPTCETYIFHYNGDCYGKVARLYFLDFIRPEQKFASVEQLKEQIEKDKSYALKLLAEGERL